MLQHFTSASRLSTHSIPCCYIVLFPWQKTVFVSLPDLQINHIYEHENHIRKDPEITEAIY